MHTVHTFSYITTCMKKLLFFVGLSLKKLLLKKVYLKNNGASCGKFFHTYILKIWFCCLGPRWIAHKHHAVVAVIDKYGIYMQYIANLADGNSYPRQIKINLSKRYQKRTSGWIPILWNLLDYCGSLPSQTIVRYLPGWGCWFRGNTSTRISNEAKFSKNSKQRVWEVAKNKMLPWTSKDGRQELSFGGCCSNSLWVGKGRCKKCKRCLD